MATKDRCLSFIDKFNQSDGSCTSNQFTNLNLNQNSESSNVNFVQSENISCKKKQQQNSGKQNKAATLTTLDFCALSKFVAALSIIKDYLEHEKCVGVMSKHIANYNSWKKFDKNLLNSKPSDSLINYNKKEKDEFLISKNVSALSLHISAYESTTINSDFENKIIQDKSDREMTIKNDKQLFTLSSLNIQNPFEFPRQQKDIKSEPEIMQFKTSQKLLDSNKSNLTTKVKEEPSENNEKCFPRKRPIVEDSNSTRNDANQTCSSDATPAKRPYERQERILIEVIEIPNNVVGLVIGRGGDQVQAIQTETGCHVQMAGEPTPQDSRYCTLNGTRENIDRAKYMINDIITQNSALSSSEYTMFGQQQQSGGNGGQTPPTQGGGIPPGCVQRILSIPGTKCGLIIGRNGETIKSLQETLGVKMLLIQENQAISHGPKPLRITGTPDKVENACRTIESIINSEDGRPQYAKSVGEVIVPRSSVGIIIGKSGETIKRLINESGCKIQFKPDEDPNTPDRCATLQGTPDQIARATQMISDLLQRSQNSGVTETFLMHVPANKTGLVIGKGGDTIKQICGESGAHVELSRDPPPNASEKIFVIKGSPYQIHHAQHIIRIKVGDIPPGTPVPHFSGSTSGGAAPAMPTANPYGTGFDGYNQWQQNGAYTTAQTDANQWSNYYQQQQQQPQAVSAYTNAAAVYGATGASATPATVASTQQQQAASGGAPVQDYSAQWAEYYRQMGMHEKAALVEEQAKKQQTSSTSQQASSGYSTGNYN